MSMAEALLILAIVLTALAGILSPTVTTWRRRRRRRRARR